MMSRENKERAQYLLLRLMAGEATLQERAELAAALREEKDNESWGELLEEIYESDTANYEYDSAQWDPVLRKLLEPRIKKVRWKRIAVAASIFALLGIALFVIRDAQTGKKKDTVAIARNDVGPGSYKARLTLADGSVVILDSAKRGELAKQGGTALVNKEGQLVYASPAANAEVLYNTVSTAKGETYTMTLADGSRVWLNSGSSVYFPVAFPGKERRIEVTGEVYVKVAHNAAQPFIASANGMEVLALGTEFNIDAYSDEDNINATLVEGSVKVSKGSSITVLKPGQQTQVTNDGVLTNAKEVNLDEITAWKEGWFHFENADLKTILRQFARWYDIEVTYEGPVTNRKFLAIVKRSSTLRSVLEMLQDNNIEYRIEGKKLIVKSG